MSSTSAVVPRTTIAPTSAGSTVKNVPANVNVDEEIPDILNEDITTDTNVSDGESFIEDSNSETPNTVGASARSESNIHTESPITPNASCEYGPNDPPSLAIRTSMVTETEPEVIIGFGSTDTELIKIMHQELITIKKAVVNKEVAVAQGVSHIAYIKVSSMTLFFDICLCFPFRTRFTSIKEYKMFITSCRHQEI